MSFKKINYQMDLTQCIIMLILMGFEAMHGEVHV